MGQGTVTSLSQLLAEELECDWGKFRTEFPPVDKAFGFQGVVGSQSIRTSWDPLRKAGATAREMLVHAAAQTWSVDKSQLPRRERLRHQHRDQRQTELRKAGGRGCEAAGAH